VRFVDVVGLLLVYACFTIYGFRVNSWLIHPRAVAMVALIPLCWHLARWSTGRSWALVPAALWFVAIFISLSRMATGAAITAVALTLILHARPRKGVVWHRAAILGALLAAAVLAIATVDPFRARLMKQDRTPLWRRVASSALESPVIGKGPGSSQAGPALRYWWSSSPNGQPSPSLHYEYWEYWAPHPHNEYLRVWHDLGVPGLVFFLLALGKWARTLFRAAFVGAGPMDTRAPELQRAGLLVLTALLIAMTTDNPLVYPFVIAPAAVLIGTGLGAATSVGSSIPAERGGASTTSRQR
jgi:O-antigen ligase